MRPASTISAKPEHALRSTGAVKPTAMLSSERNCQKWPSPVRTKVMEISESRPRRRNVAAKLAPESRPLRAHCMTESEESPRPAVPQSRFTSPSAMPWSRVVQGTRPHEKTAKIAGAAQISFEVMDGILATTHVRSLLNVKWVVAFRTL